MREGREEGTFILRQSYQLSSRCVCLWGRGILAMYGQYRNPKKHVRGVFQPTERTVPVSPVPFRRSTNSKVRTA